MALISKEADLRDAVALSALRDRWRPFKGSLDGSQSREIHGYTMASNHTAPFPQLVVHVYAIGTGWAVRLDDGTDARHQWTFSTTASHAVTFAEFVVTKWEEK